MASASPYATWRVLIVTQDNALRKQLNKLFLPSFAAVEFALSNLEARKRVAYPYGPTIKLIMIDINMVSPKSTTRWNLCLRRLLKSPLVTLLTRTEADPKRLELATALNYVGILDTELPAKDFIGELLISTGHSGKAPPKTTTKPGQTPKSTRQARGKVAAKTPIAKQPPPEPQIEVETANADDGSDNSLIERYKIPPSPEILDAITEALQADSPNLPYIAEIIEKDLVITENLLRTANSAFYGAAKKISTAAAAMQTIGMRDFVVVFQNVILARAFKADAVNRNEFESELWNFFVGTGLVAKAFAARVNQSEGTTVIPPDRAYSLGTMHNIGMLMLSRRSTTYATQLVKQELLNDITGAAQCTWEKAQYGIDHAKLSQLVAKCWRLTNDDCEAILYQPLRTRVFHSDRGIRMIEAILSLADLMVTPQIFKNITIPDQDALLMGLLNTAGLTLVDWKDVTVSTTKEMEKYGIKQPAQAASK